MPIAAPRDPLYHQARQHLLHSDNVSVAHLQRRLRIGYQRAIDLRAALEGDAVEYRAGTDSWHIRPDADRVTDFLLEEKLAQAAHLVQNAKALVIAAGAGMGIDSGLPDFRGDEGFWRAYPALGQQQLPFVRIASPYAFQKRPAIAWGFYGHRLNLYRAATPHAGFGLLHAWGQRMPQGCFVFTSNVDGHFQKAGFPSARVYECHGSIHRIAFFCFSCIYLLHSSYGKERLPITESSSDDPLPPRYSHSFRKPSDGNNALRWVRNRIRAYPPR